MTTAIYLDHYLESLESLPVELQRNFKLMRDLDGRAQTVMQEIDRLGMEFLEIAGEATQEEKKEHVARIHKHFAKAKEYGDDKVQLAIQTYELVDKHIRRLDSDLARFESEIKNGPSASANTTATTTTTPGEPGPVVNNKRKLNTSRKKEKESSKKSKAETEDKNKGAAAASPARKKHKSEIVIAAEQAASSNSSAGEVLDMPVDPNEPTYCICHQVSYGQMIACDHIHCEIEWFHIGCMGLSSIPKGKWFCPKCTPTRKK